MVAIIDATDEIVNKGQEILVAIIKSDQKIWLGHFGGFVTVEKHPRSLNN